MGFFGEGDLAMTVPPKTEMLGIYPANYHEARDLFRQAAQDLGAHLENHVVLSGAEYGGDLTIDVAVVGVEDPTWSLVVSSGLHGVEGFFGSALQTAYLRQVQRQDVIDSKGQLVLIHAINPFGFFALRRVNEDNVDLNRNFLVTGETYSGSSQLYKDLDDFLNPASPPHQFDGYLVKALWNIGRFGYSKLKQIVAEGQYDYPKGIFFGGHKTAQSTAIIETHILRWARGRHVVHLDFHTGLGKRGKYKLLVPGKRSQTDLTYYSTFLGPEIEHLGSDRGIAYKTKGDFGQYVLSISGTTDYHFFFAEFGTYSGIRVLKALRTENQAFFFSSQPSVRERARAELLERFCPRSPVWRQSVANQGLKLLQAAEKMASLLGSRAMPDGT